MTKAEKFLEVADIALSCHLYDPCVSLAVSAGINASDAFCILMHGKYLRGQAHDEVLTILRRLGAQGQQIALRLGPLLKLKNRAQYEIRSCTQSDADKSFKLATEIHRATEQAISISKR